MVTILITILFNTCNFWVEKSYISRKRYFNKKILILIKLTNGHSKRDGVNFTTTMLPATRYIFPFPNRIFIIYLIMDGNEEYFVLFKRAARNISSIIVCHKHLRGPIKEYSVSMLLRRTYVIDTISHHLTFGIISEGTFIDIIM